MSLWGKHSYNGVPLSNKKEILLHTVICSNVDKSQMHHASWKRPKSKGYTLYHTLWFHLYDILEKSEVSGRKIISGRMRWGEELRKTEFFYGKGTLLYHSHGCDYPSLWASHNSLNVYKCIHFNFELNSYLSIYWYVCIYSIQ